MPEVSVLVPNYNHAKYLTERIDTILNQTYSDFELIILDDHSSDESRDIIEKYRFHPKVSWIVYNDVNSGSPFRQWAKGIKMAQGKYIWIAESDDSCESTFLGNAVCKMNEFPSVGVVYAQSVEFEEGNGKRFLSFHDHPRFSGSFLNSYFNNGREEIRDKLMFENTIPNASGVLFRKDIYLATSGVEESMGLCGDWMLWVKMLMISDIYFLAKPLNHFRLTSISVRSRISKTESFHERFAILRFIRQNHIKEVRKSEIRLLEMLFSSFKLYQFHKPLSMVLGEWKYIDNAGLKILYAILLSMIERTRRKISHPKTQKRSLAL